MDLHPSGLTRVYDVAVAFLSDGEAFATPSFDIEIADGIDPHRIARARAEQSPYYNRRIPGLDMTIALIARDPDDHEPLPPSFGVTPICPHCGSGNIIRHAVARWNDLEQDWELSGTYDHQTCNACEAEGDDFAVWAPASSRAAADMFLWDVAETLGDLTAVQNPTLQLFCLRNHQSLSVDEAAAQWRG